jgi:hypothetical protein
MNHFPRAAVQLIPDGNVHVIPVKDIKEHEESITCWCRPNVSADYENLVIHNAFAEEYGDERNLE